LAQTSKIYYGPNIPQMVFDSFFAKATDNSATTTSGVSQDASMNREMTLDKVHWYYEN